MKPLLEVFIPGNPVPRPSSRQWRHQPGLRAWYDTVAWTVKAKRVGVAPLEGPVVLWLSFHTGRQMDASNALKAVEDALIGVLYMDDRQVRESHVRILATGKVGVRLVAFRLGEGPSWPEGVTL